MLVRAARHSRAKLMLDVVVEGAVHAPAAALAVGLPALILLCVAPLLCYHTPTPTPTPTPLPLPYP